MKIPQVNKKQNMIALCWRIIPKRQDVDIHRGRYYGWW